MGCEWSDQKWNCDTTEARKCSWATLMNRILYHSFRSSDLVEGMTEPIGTPSACQPISKLMERSTSPRGTSDGFFGNWRSWRACQETLIFDQHFTSNQQGCYPAASICLASSHILATSKCLTQKIFSRVDFLELPSFGMCFNENDMTPTDSSLHTP